MTENNKLFNALNQLQLNTNNNDLKALEKEILTEENLQALVVNQDEIEINGLFLFGLDTYLNSFLQNLEKIDTILSNGTTFGKNSLDLIIGTIFKDGKVFENNKVDPNYTPKTENGFAIKFINNRHFITVKIKEKVNEEKVNEEKEKDETEDETIFDSLKDGRQVGQCCGIHALEGVLIAEELTKNGKNIEEFKAKHNNQLVKTSEDDLIEQRKILFKMEILDALNNAENIILEEDKFQELYNLYFEEFQARCAALQAVKKELEPAVKQTEAQEQHNSVAAPQQIQQKDEVTPEALEQHDAVTQQQIKQKREVETVAPKVETQKVETEVQKPATRIVVENPGDIPQEEEQKEEDKQLKYGTPVVKNKEGENDKKFDLPSEPKKESEIVNTQEVTEGRQECDTLSKKEPDPSRDTQNSEISTTSSILSEHPKMKQDTVYDWTKKEDTKIETYDIEDNKIKKIDNINEKAAQLYLDILMQVLKEAKEKSGLEEITEEKITAIRNKTEKKIDACFTIRDENNNIIENLTKEDKEDLELARTDYKNRAEADERVINIFNKLNELKKYQGATKEIQEQLIQGQLFHQEKTTVSVKM